MKLDSLVIVVVRVMALECMFQTVVHLPVAVLGSIGGIAHAMPLYLLGFGIAVLSAMLWKFAARIARLVTRQLPQDISFGVLSLIDCYSIAFIGMGVLFLGSNLPLIVINGFYIFMTAANSHGPEWMAKINFYKVSEPIMQFVIGLLLFLNGRTWAKAVSVKQESSESPDKPQEITPPSQQPTPSTPTPGDNEQSK